MVSASQSNRPDFNLKAITRPNIWSLTPYRCARDDYDEGILLDANENALGTALDGLATDTTDVLNAIPKSADFPSSKPDSTLNRYPDPHQTLTKQLLTKFRQIPTGPEGIFVGVGSDESIDLLIRVFCVPGNDKICVCPPTYGMYSVAAKTNDVGVVEVPLILEGKQRWQLDVEKVWNVNGSE